MIWANLTITLKIMRQVSKIDYSHFTIPLVKDPTEIHVLSVSSDKCSPVKSRGGMKDHLIRTWLFTRSLLEEATRILNLCVKGSRRELEERLKERSYREIKSVISGMYSKTNLTKDGK